MIELKAYFGLADECTLCTGLSHAAYMFTHPESGQTLEDQFVVGVAICDDCYHATLLDLAEFKHLMEVNNIILGGAVHHVCLIGHTDIAGSFFAASDRARYDVLECQICEKLWMVQKGYPLIHRLRPIADLTTWKPEVIRG